MGNICKFEQYFWNFSQLITRVGPHQLRQDQRLQKILHMGLLKFRLIANGPKLNKWVWTCRLVTFEQWLPKLYCHDVNIRKLLTKANLLSIVYHTVWQLLQVTVNKRKRLKTVCTIVHTVPIKEKLPFSESPPHSYVLTHYKDGLTSIIVYNPIANCK